MAFFYDFERWQREHPPRPGDPTSLDVARTARNLIDLRGSLDAEGTPNYVPPRSTYERLLVATWNIRAFGETRRYEESLWYIAEVLSRFDIIAIQEVTRSLDDLERVRGLLGPWWRYLVTDVTEGSAGNDERLAFLFDSRKVRFGGMAGELVLPPLEDEHGESHPVTQIARTPYMAVFRCGWFDFMLATVHLIWDEEEADHPPRVWEVQQVAQSLAARVEQAGTAARNMILLGDFNMFNADGAAMEALTEARFQIPHGRDDLRATNVGQVARYYDQIAYLFAEDPELEPARVGVVDFFEAVYSDGKLANYEAELRTATGAVPADPGSYYRNHWRRHQMSDHLVLWAELPIEFAAPYLRAHAP